MLNIKQPLFLDLIKLKMLQ
jgi:hypothetical protein